MATDASEVPRIKWYVQSILVLVVTAIVAAVMYACVMLEREVSQYSVYAFEDAARAKLDAKHYDGVKRIANGAMATAMERADFRGRALLLRARAEAATGDAHGSVSDTIIAAREWARAPYNADEEVRAEIETFSLELGNGLARVGESALALRAYSAGALGSGRAFHYLQFLDGRLDSRTRGVVFDNTMILPIEEFIGTEIPSWKVYVENQGRSVLVNTTDVSESYAADQSVLLSLSASTGNGICRYGFPVYIRLIDRVATIQLCVKEEIPGSARLFLGLWFEGARRSNVIESTLRSDLGLGWVLLKAEGNWLKEQSEIAAREGFDASDGVILSVGIQIDSGSANRFWADSIDIYFP